MERSETIKLFSLITNSYDMFDITEEKLQVWSELLSDQDFGDVLGNFKEHVKREKYPPSIAELRGSSTRANSGYLNKGETLRIEEMKKGALKEIPEDLIPDFIKERRAAK